MRFLWNKKQSIYRKEMRYRNLIIYKSNKKLLASFKKPTEARFSHK